MCFGVGESFVFVICVRFYGEEIEEFLVVGFVNEWIMDL
jgi:hypothetical protein